MNAAALPAAGCALRAPRTAPAGWQRRIRTGRPRRWAARRARASAIAAARPRPFAAPARRRLITPPGVRLPFADLVAVGATLGAVALWGFALTLLAL